MPLEVVIEARRRGRPAGRADVIGLATGSSPLGLYAVLSRAVGAGEGELRAGSRLRARRVRRAPARAPAVVPRGAAARGGWPSWAPAGSAARAGRVGRLEEALAAGAASYERRIPEAGGVDVQILGIGANGHLGFNEPGSSLTSRTRVKRLLRPHRADNARFFDSLDVVPTHCVTQGLGTVLDARVSCSSRGGGKAAAVAAAVEGPLSASCPASVLQWHADAVVVLDEAAAAGLANRDYYDASAAGLEHDRVTRPCGLPAGDGCDAWDQLTCG